MSKLPEKRSHAASGQQGSDSVFDFLYHDPLRIASFLGQFDPSGVAQSYKRTDQTSQNSSDQSNDALKFNVGVASGQLGERISVTEGAQHGSERTYDPLWSNARAFLDYLEQHDLLERDLDQAQIGRFVLFSGELTLTDLSVLREAWKLGSIQKIMGLAPEKSAKHDSSSSKKGPDQENKQFAFDMLSILPHSLQVTIDSGSDTVWANLKPNCLATDSDDLMLKHGFRIPGIWSVVGILDAQPFSGVFDSTPIALRENGEQAAAYLFQTLAPLTRTIMGRPNAAYGITPLLLFREVSAKS